MSLDVNIQNRLENDASHREREERRLTAELLGSHLPLDLIGRVSSTTPLHAKGPAILGCGSIARRRDVAMATLHEWLSFCLARPV